LKQPCVAPFFFALFWSFNFSSRAACFPILLNFFLYSSYVPLICFRKKPKPGTLQTPPTPIHKMEATCSFRKDLTLKERKGQRSKSVQPFSLLRLNLKRKKPLGNNSAGPAACSVKSRNRSQVAFVFHHLAMTTHELSHTIKDNASAQKKCPTNRASGIGVQGVHIRAKGERSAASDRRTIHLIWIGSEPTTGFQPATFDLTMHYRSATPERSSWDFLKSHQERRQITLARWHLSGILHDPCGFSLLTVIS
jgi:hypothetical protein